MKVFLGSSYTDLQPHRKAVIEALERLSISVAAMELWHAKSGDPLSVCLEHVRVADVYICIIAHRYGTLTEDGRSFTHQEYDCAFAAGIECLVFIIDDDYPVSPQFIDIDDVARRLAQFKSTPKHRHVCSFFTRPEDLAFKVTESL